MPYRRNHRWSEVEDEYAHIERAHAFMCMRSQRRTVVSRELPRNVPEGIVEHPRVEACEGDDERFLNVVRDVLGHGLAFHRPVIARLVRVDNWFGQRWLGFSGKVLGAFGVGKSRRVIPPFVPSRIVSESLWRTNGPLWVREAKYEPLHKRMPSAENLERFFDLHCPETLAVWFSSRSLHNGRGAIMVYSTAGDPRTASWYGELAVSPAGDWSLRVLKGLTLAAFASLTTPVPAQESASPVPALF